MPMTGAPTGVNLKKDKSSRPLKGWQTLHLTSGSSGTIGSEAVFKNYKHGNWQEEYSKDLKTVQP